MHFEYSYVLEEGLNVLAALISGLPATLWTIGSYVLTALALYTLAKRRGIRHGWLAWIPVASCWILGSLSDQYRYLVKGQVKAKRKVLLALSILLSGLILALTVMCIAVGISAAMGFRREMAGIFIALMALALAVTAAALVRLVVRFMALSDLYRSMDPENAALFLVLSILFPVTEPFFLVFNRNRELGMPPRREAPPPTEPWEQL